MKVHFKLTPEELQMLDRNMNRIVEPGWFTVMVGSSSEDIRLEGRFEIESNDMISKPYDPTPISSGLTW